MRLYIYHAVDESPCNIVINLKVDPEGARGSGPPRTSQVAIGLLINPGTEPHREAIVPLGFKCFSNPL